MGQNSLYSRPDLYDVMAPHDPVLEHFYVELARERGGRVLDLACGSGRLTVPLARAGLQATGGDLSAEMLQHARRRARAEAVALDLVELDMRDFDLKGRTFETIIVAIYAAAQVAETHLPLRDILDQFARRSDDFSLAGVTSDVPETHQKVADTFLKLGVLDAAHGGRKILGHEFQRRDRRGCGQSRADMRAVMRM
ncbi:class I SAM-dependent methyltransferase [Bradyrhizobium sp. USDA 3364]